MSALAGLVGCTIVAASIDAHSDNLEIGLSDGTTLWVGDPTGDQGLMLNRSKTEVAS